MKKPTTATILLAALALAGCGEPTVVGDSPEAANGISAKDAAPPTVAPAKAPPTPPRESRPKAQAEPDKPPPRPQTIAGAAPSPLFPSCLLRAPVVLPQSPSGRPKG